MKWLEKMRKCNDLSLNDKVKQAANKKIVELFDSIAYEEPFKGSEFLLSKAFHFMVSFILYNDELDDYNKIIEYCDRADKLLNNQNNIRAKNCYIKIGDLL